MVSLGPYAEKYSCFAMRRAAAACFRGLQHLPAAGHGYADIKVLEMLKVLPGLARLTHLTIGDTRPPCTDVRSVLRMHLRRVGGLH